MEAQAALLQRMNTAVQNAHKAMTILKKENDKLTKENEKLKEEVSSLKKEMTELRRQAKSSSSSSRISLPPKVDTSSPIGGGELVPSRSNSRSKKSKSTEVIDPNISTDDSNPIQNSNEEGNLENNDILNEDNAGSSTSIMESVLLVTESFESQRSDIISNSKNNAIGSQVKDSSIDTRNVILSVLGKRLGAKCLKSSTIKKWEESTSSRVNKLCLLFSQLSSDNFRVIANEILKRGFQSEEVTNAFIKVVNRFFLNNFENVLSYSAFENLLSRNSYYLKVMLAFLQELYMIGTSYSLSLLEEIVHRLKSIVIGRLLRQEGSDPCQQAFLGRPSLNPNNSVQYSAYVHSILLLKIKHIHSPNAVYDDAAEADAEHGGDHAIPADNFYFDLSEEEEEEDDEDKEEKTETKVNARQINSKENNPPVIVPAGDTDTFKDVSQTKTNTDDKSGTTTDIPPVPTWMITTEQFESDDDNEHKTAVKVLPSSTADKDKDPQAEEQERKLKLMQCIDEIMDGSSSDDEDETPNDTHTSSNVTQATAMDVDEVASAAPDNRSPFQKAMDDLTSVTLAELLLKREAHDALMWLLFLETCCSLEMYALLLDGLQAWWMAMTMFYPVDVYVVLHVFRKYGDLWRDEDASQTNKVKLHHLMCTIIQSLHLRLPEFMAVLENVSMDENHHAEMEFQDVAKLFLHLLQSCQDVLSTVPSDRLCVHPVVSQVGGSCLNEYDVLQTGLWQGLLQQLNIVTPSNEDCLLLNGLLPGEQSVRSIYHMYQHMAQHVSVHMIASYSIPDAYILSPEAHVGDLMVTSITRFESFCAELGSSCDVDVRKLHRRYIDHMANVFDETFFRSTESLSLSSIMSMQQSVQDLNKVLICPFKRLLFDENMQFFRVSGSTGRPANYAIHTKNLIQNLTKKIHSFVKHLRQTAAAAEIPSLNSLDWLGPSSPVLTFLQEKRPQMLPFYATGRALGIFEFLSYDTVVSVSHLLAYCDKILFHPIHIDVHRLDTVGRDLHEKIRVMYTQVIEVFGMIVWERLLQSCLLTWRGCLQAVRHRIERWHITDEDGLDAFFAWCDLTASLVDVIWQEVPHPWGCKHFADRSYEISLVVRACLMQLEAHQRQHQRQHQLQQPQQSTVLYHKFLSLQSTLLQAQRSLFPCFLLAPTPIEAQEIAHPPFYNALDYVNAAIGKDDIVRRQHCKAVGFSMRYHLIDSSLGTPPSSSAAVPFTWDNRLRARFTNRVASAVKPLTERERRETWSHWCIWHHIAKLHDPTHILPQEVDAQGTYPISAFAFDPAFYVQFQTNYLQRSYLSSSDVHTTTVNNSKYYVILGESAYAKQSTDLTSVVAAVVPHLPADWDVLFLGGYCPKNNSMYKEGATYSINAKEKLGFYKINYIFDGIGYVLRESTAKKLIADNAHLTAPVYDHLAMMLYYEELQGYALIEPVIVLDIKPYISMTADYVKKKPKLN